MRMLIVNPIAGCGYALKVMEQVQSVLTARNLPFRVYGRLSSKCNTEKDLKRGAPA